MKALVLAAPGSMAVEEIAEPEIGHRDVLLRVERVGVCGTDLHIVAGSYPPTPYPIVPGHETVGIVERAGALVKDLAPGTRVAVDATLWCDDCPACSRRQFHLCDNGGGIGGTINGGMAEFVRVPRRNCQIVPNELAASAAAFAEPLSCAIHGLNQLGSIHGRTALVIGAGTMGLLAAQALRARGATRVEILNRSQPRLDIAARLGLAGHLLGDAPCDRFQTVVEATGTSAGFKVALDRLDRSAELLCLGVAPEGVNVDFSLYALYRNEVSIHGSMGANRTIGEAVDLLAAGLVRTSEMIGMVATLDDYAAAFQATRSGAGKVQFALARGDEVPA